MSRGSPPHPPEPPGADERLNTAQAFSRFVGRVTPRAGRWFSRLGGLAADRDDVLQETLLRAYQKRDAYDPARGRWEDWFYGLFVGEALNHQRRRSRRIKHVEVAAGDLPDTAAEGPSPEEEAERTMLRRLAEKCQNALDRQTLAIVLAKDVDGLDMTAIAAAHGVSVSTAYVYYHAGRERLQQVLDGERDRKLALGLAVLPISLDQVLASEPEPTDISEATMQRIWEKLDRRMAVDKAAGRLGDDGTAVHRYLGSPGGASPAPPRARPPRSLMGPRVSHVLTGLVGAAGGALVTYQIMKGPAEQRHDATIEARPVDPASSAHIVPPLGPEAPDAPAPDARASEAPELRADAGPPAARASAAPERSESGTATIAAARDIAEEQAMFDEGSTAYQEGHYAEAIDALRKHESKFPRGQFAPVRERLLTLALIRAGREAEARERIERLRRANPESPLLQEMNEASSAERTPRTTRMH